jgi:CRISP-associated protein Cas1
MHQLLNTIYVTTESAYLHLDHETLKVEVDGTTKLQVPLHHLGGIVCFGNVLMSPALLHRCAEDGRSVVLLDRHGRFKARVEGPISGNVMLRRAQHLAISDPIRPASIARYIVAGKIQNARQVVLRGGREAITAEDMMQLQECASAMGNILIRLSAVAGLDQARGLEGEAARAYFAVFDRMVREDRDAFRFDGRSRRPPLDRIELISIYGILGLQ